MIGLIILGSLLFTIVYGIVEALHDVNVIKNDRGKSEYSTKWHRLGFIQNALAFTPLTITLFLFNWELAIPVIIGLGVLFWQLHDSIIGWKLHKDIFYLGNSGWDEQIDAIFWEGSVLSILRMGALFFSTWEVIRLISNI
jgi:hypothetical protein